MRLPCENFIRYLLTGGDSRWSFADVRRYLERLGYPQPTRPYLMRLREDLEQSRPKPYLVGGSPPRRWLHAQGLLPLYERDDAADNASEILGDTEMRPLVESILISGIPLNHAQGIIKGLRGTTPTLETLQHYYDFYWNRGLLRQEEWLKFLVDYPDGDALSLVYLSPPDYLMHHLGVQNDKSLQEMIRESANIAYIRLLETRVLSLSNDTANIIAKLSRVLTSADQQISSTDKLGQLIEQMRSVGLSLMDADIKKLSEAPSGEILDGTVLESLPAPSIEVSHDG